MLMDYIRFQGYQNGHRWTKEKTTPTMMEEKDEYDWEPTIIFKCDQSGKVIYNA